MHIACRLLAKVTMLTAKWLVQPSRLGPVTNSVLVSWLGRPALNQATRVHTPAEAFGKRIGKNRSVQKGLVMNIVAGFDKIGLFRKG